MKMIFTIVHNDDALLLINELNENHFYVTRLSTSGGFLKKGNTTLMIGVEDDQVEQVCELIRLNAGKRQQIMYTSPSTSGGSSMYNSVSSVPVNMNAGGATIFVLPVDDFRKV